MPQRRELGGPEKRQVRERLREELASWAGLRFAVLHGGFLEGRSFGDVDIAVSLATAHDPRAIMAEELRLAVRLESIIGLPIDVRAVETAPVSFRYAVTRGELLCARDVEAWANFREQTWNDYFDFAPLREEALRDLVGIPSRKPAG